MPPSKRAATKPEEAEPEAVTPEHGTAADPDEGDGPDELADDVDGADGQPQHSDLQGVEQPCAECFPNGWPEGAFAVGCTHGTWVREDA